MFCEWAHIGSFLYAAGMTFIPLAISGGIHMDGYADTIDALSSHAAPEKKRQILKDSHAGAFAIIYTAAYLIVYCAFASELVVSVSTGIFILMCHVFARCIGAFAGTAFPGSGHEGLLASFRDGATRKAVLIISIFCIICCVIMVWLFPQGGIACIVSAILLLLYLKKMSIKEFGGMSGDLAGFIITISELVFTACFAISFKVVCL